MLAPLGAVRANSENARRLFADDAKVLVYDPRTWTADTPDEKKWITLDRGDRYDLKGRKQIR